VPLTFQVIIGTVAVYGMTASWVAHRLRLARPNPQGVLFAGAHSWAQQMALVLQDAGFRVVMVDSNWDNIAGARKAGLRVYYSSILSENLLGDLQLDGIGRLLAVTPNDEVNSLAALHFVDVFGRSDVYQLVRSDANRKGRQSDMPSHLSGRSLFRGDASFEYLSYRFRSGAVVKKTGLTEEFDFAAFRRRYSSALLLFVVTESGSLSICSAADPPSPSPGQTVIAVVDADQQEGD
jgi:hypothetical protein